MKKKNHAKSAGTTHKGKNSSNFKKLYLKTKELCKVTFRLPKEAAPDARVVTLVGDFNQWNRDETPMQKMKNGDFKVTVELACNNAYKFKYLIDHSTWENDWKADEYIPNDFGGDDSLVKV